MAALPTGSRSCCSLCLLSTRSARARDAAPRSRPGQSRHRVVTFSGKVLAAGQRRERVGGGPAGGPRRFFGREGWDDYEGCRALLALRHGPTVRTCPVTSRTSLDASTTTPALTAGIASP